MRIANFVALALLAAPIAGFAQTTTVAVPGQANIFAAGLNAVPPGVPSCPATNGVLPTEIAIPSGATTFTVSNVTGTAFCTGVNSTPTADGSCFSGTPTIINTDTNISGITNTSANMFLVGTMTGAGAPAAPAPAAGDFSSNMSFTSLSPVLQQSFFIGDGLTGTGSGATQTFMIPTGATRLFLGFADAYAYSGQEGCYSDNGGSLSVTVQFNGTVAQTPVSAPVNSWQALVILTALLALGALGSRVLRRQTS